MNKDPLEILRRVKALEIKTRGWINEVFSGEYHSVFKGQGIEFSEVREYCPGDDIRSIDWNVTARMGHPFVKKYIEERQLHVLLMVDQSASQEYGTHEKFKNTIAAEIAAILAFSVIRNNDRIGLLTFTDQIEKYLPPRKGKTYGMRIIREVLFGQSVRKKTNLNIALEYIVRILKRRCTIFLISDFQDWQHGEGNKILYPFEKALKLTAKKNDLIALEVYDPSEESIPESGTLRVEDSETGMQSLINTRDQNFRDWYLKKKIELSENLKCLFRSNAIDYIRINTHSSYQEQLRKFFKMREKRIK